MEDIENFKTFKGETDETKFLDKCLEEFQMIVIKDLSENQKLDETAKIFSEIGQRSCMLKGG